MAGKKHTKKECVLEGYKDFLKYEISIMKLETWLHDFFEIYKGLKKSLQNTLLTVYINISFSCLLIHIEACDYLEDFGNNFKCNF